MKFGATCKRWMKGWVKDKLKLTTLQQQRTFLLKCRQHDILPPHIYNIKFTTYLGNYQLNRKGLNLKSMYQRRLLNLEIKDIHSHISFLNKKIEVIESRIKSKLPDVIWKDFCISNNNKFKRCSSDYRNKLIKKFNNINGLQNESLYKFLNTDKSKWIVNESNIKIPENIMNFLSLGNKFSVPVNVNDYRDRTDITLNVIKSFESSCGSFPENLLDKLRAVMVSLINRYLCCSKHISYIDSFILNEIY